MDRSVESLRADTTSYAHLGVTEIADHYEKLIRELDSPPIIMGHSFGGLVTQILLDRGLGAAGVAIDPAPPKGVLVIPPASLRVASVSLRNPGNRHRAQMLTAKQFRFAFGNTLSEAESQAVYERHAVPGPGRTLFQAGLANFNPKAATKINFHNDDRAPLLILGGGKDHTVPAASTRSNFKLQQKSAAVTEYKEFRGRSHYTIGQQGWEEAPSSRRSAMAHSHGGEKAESGAARSLQADPRCHQGDPGQHDDLIHESARLGLIQMG